MAMTPTRTGLKSTAIGAVVIAVTTSTATVKTRFGLPSPLPGACSDAHDVQDAHDRPDDSPDRVREATIDSITFWGGKRSKIRLKTGVGFRTSENSMKDAAQMKMDAIKSPTAVPANIALNPRALPAVSTRAQAARPTRVGASAAAPGQSPSPSCRPA